ncbi:hypothetical protein [Sulfitobacter faviae]|uniref:hypothetical protein n=1 Tax=Sulfitobacter faviae TaxID=1775881 RepID=UPI002458FA4E|nr:hypothetical protein [Sulfitobacter faviae]
MVQALLDEMGALLRQHDSGATSEDREAIDHRFEVLRAQVREHLDAPSPDFIILNRNTGEEIPVELKQTVGRGLRLQKPNKGHTTAVEPRTEKPSPTPRQLKRPPKK